MTISSRRLQNIQHLVGGANSLLLLFSGIMLGKGEYLYTAIMAILFFLLSRLNSEIFYRILCKVQSEEDCGGKSGEKSDING